LCPRHREDEISGFDVRRGQAATGETTPGISVASQLRLGERVHRVALESTNPDAARLDPSNPVSRLVPYQPV